jgi:hypothetical protein
MLTEIKVSRLLAAIVEILTKKHSPACDLNALRLEKRKDDQST